MQTKLSKGLTHQQYLGSLCSTLGNKAPSEKTVYNLFAKFRPGRASASKNRPKSVAKKKHGCFLCNMIEEDGHLIYREIETTVALLLRAVHLI